MNAKERFEARLAGKPVDRIPNLSIVMLFAAQHAGIPYGQFVTDYRALAEAQLKAAEDFGLDILSTMSDPFRETSDFGAQLIYPNDDLPICPAPRIRDISEFSTLSLWDPCDSVHMLDRIRAVEVFSRSKKQEYPILGWVESPLVELCDLMTMQEGLAALIEEPEAAEEALDLLAEQAIRCALAQIEAGADVIGMGDAAASALGIRVKRLRMTAMVCAAASAAAVVSFAGLIGFVGLIVPHIAKKLAGEQPARSLPVAALTGGVLVILADLLGRTLFAPSELPVGILMSLVGGPYFLILLCRRNRYAHV